MKYTILVLALVGVLLVAMSVATAAGEHAQARLEAVGDSGVTGLVNLAELPRDRGTQINVVAFGLEPGESYVSLYYDNHTCELEPYSEDDVIGDIYTANRGGIGVTVGQADDELGEINSVSVRRASDFELLACADIHPGS